MARWVVLALALAGCDVALGLDRVERSDHLRVEGSVVHRYTVNDATFSPQLIERVVPPDQLPLSITLEDGSRPTVDYRDDGTFSFFRTTPSQPYRIVFSTDMLRAEMVDSSPTLRMGFMTGGRLDRRPAVSTKIEFPFPIQGVAGSYATVASTGVFTNTSTMQFGPTVSWDWRLSNAASGSVTGLLDAALNDRVYAIEYEAVTGFNSTTFSRIRAVSSASVTQVLGGITTLPAPAPVTANSCVRIVAPNSQEAARLFGAAQREYAYTSSNWVVYSAPAPEELGLAGVLYPAICGLPDTPDLDVSPEFHDPYPGTTLLIESATAGYYPVQLPGTNPQNYATVTRLYELAERGAPGDCKPAPAVLTGMVGIPGAHALDGQLLEGDNQIVPLDLSRPVELSWSVVAPGPVDLFLISMQELVDVGGQTTNIQRWGTSVAGQARVTLEPALLEPGHTYIVAVTSSLGRPGIATGDYLQFQFPMQTSTVWSTTFTVEAL